MIRTVADTDKSNCIHVFLCGNRDSWAAIISRCENDEITLVKELHGNIHGISSDRNEVRAIVEALKFLLCYLPPYTERSGIPVKLITESYDLMENLKKKHNGEGTRIGNPDLWVQYESLKTKFRLQYFFTEESYQDCPFLPVKKKRYYYRFL